MADLEFFFDPVCPWAWVTSRWVVEVRRQRPYEVEWKFISLRYLNEHNTADWYDDHFRSGHEAGLRCHRVAAEVRNEHGNAGVDAFYTQLGERVHVGGRGDDLRAEPVAFIAEALAGAGLPTALAQHAGNAAHDAVVRDETELALSRAGRDVGTPVLTFRPGAANEGTFFGPVISRAPRGAEALRLWDAVEVIATTPGVNELKRSLRAPLSFD